MKYTSLNLVTGPEVEPISVTELKTHLRISHSDEDAYLGTLIASVREEAEQITGRSFITQTWQIFMHDFPYSVSDTWWNGVRHMPIDYGIEYGYMELPKPPLQSVTHIKYYDNADTATTIAEDSYQVTTYTGLTPKKGTITLRDGYTWPTVTRNKDGVEIQFVTGYGDARTDVPASLRQVLLEECAYRYEFRGDDGCGKKVPFATKLSLFVKSFV